MTEFYNAAESEKKMNLDWKKKKVWDKLIKKNKNKEKFYFLDGPPFVTNEVHQGTMYGIFIKDSVIRYKLLKGFDVRAQPGWDTQGLPIEVVVEKKLGIKNKKEIKEFGEDKFVEECKNLVESYIKLNTEIILDYGVLWYYNEPYKTYKDEYIESIWYGIKRAYDKGLIYSGLKATWFCVRCGTPMANYEVKDKYYEKEDKSTYVLFKLKDGRYLLVWTTTPWTLPSNAAVAVNSDFKYLETEVDGKTIIIAKDREPVLKELNKEYRITKELEGRDLVGLRYIHPFPDIPQVNKNAEKLGIIIDGKEAPSEEGTPFVEINEGTGLVHVAPGHGESDYKIGITNGLPMLSPIDEGGKFTQEAGWLQGEDVLKVNDKIIDYLEKNGILFAVRKIIHDYPHCWRCKTPLISMSSKQWFLSIAKIKDELINISKGIKWTPPISENMFESWLANAEDWVISRQRYWNTPLPIWKCEACDNTTVIGSRNELLSKAGMKEIKDLHKSSLDSVKIKCDKCEGEMKRVPDVMDVWIDSGSSSFACMNYPAEKEEFSRYFPADFISEGNDQIRGWFYSLLVMGYITTDSLPYKNVAMHRFVVGEDGNKLSKSEGNYKPISELIKEGYSRDALRITLLKHSIEDVAVFTLNDLKDDTKTINLFYNLGNLYSSARDILKGEKTKELNLRTEDQWIISRWNIVKKEVQENLDNFRTDLALNKLMDFIVNDLSRTYLKLAKSRMFDDNDYTAFKTFEHTLKELSVAASVFMPFISEKIFKTVEKKGSTLTSEFPDSNEALIDNDMETRMRRTMDILQGILSAREKLKINLRRPLKSVSIPTAYSGEILEDIILRMGNILHISYELNPEEFEPTIDFSRLKQRMQQNDMTVATSKFLELTKETVIRNLRGGLKLTSEGKDYSITSAEIDLKPKSKETVQFNVGKDVVLIESGMSDEVKVLWIKREVIRAVQNMRKELGLKRTDIIKLHIAINNEEESSIKNAIVKDVFSKTGSTEGKSEKLLKVQNLNILDNNIVIEAYNNG
jgi:isoleucyl-tRNA synthetase